MQDFPPSIKPVANPEFELCATIAGGDGTDMVLIPYDRSLLLSIRGKQEMMALHSGIKLVGSFASQDSGGDFGVDYTDLGGGRVQVDTTFLPTNTPILLQVVACELRSNVLQVVLSEAQPAGDDLYSS